MNFVPSQIRTGLFGLIGLKQGFGSEYNIVNAANLVTSSGMYFQDYHSLVTVENLHNVMPSGLTDSDFNSWYRDFVYGAIVKNVSTVMQKYNVPSVFENLRLFENPLDVSDVMDIPDNTFVGFEIKLTRANNIKLVIDAIGLTIDTTNTTKDFYIFHSSQDAYIAKFTASYTANSETWNDIAQELNYVNDTYVGGTFYIGYRSQDLSGDNPINRAWSDANVSNCAHMFSIRPFQISDYNTDTLFDITALDYTADTYGLNFSFSAWSDVTKQILTQKNAFINVIGYGVAVECLERLANSIRNNEVKKETRDLAYAELNTETGLRAKLEQAIKQTNIDLQLDSLTLPKRSRITTYTAR